MCDVVCSVRGGLVEQWHTMLSSASSQNLMEYSAEKLCPVAIWRAAACKRWLLWDSAPQRNGGGLDESGGVQAAQAWPSLRISLNSRSQSRKTLALFIGGRGG